MPNSVSGQELIGAPFGCGFAVGIVRRDLALKEQMFRASLLYTEEMCASKFKLKCASSRAACLIDSLAVRVAFADCVDDEGAGEKMAGRRALICARQSGARWRHSHHK